MIDHRIILQKIDENRPSLKTTAVGVMGGVGQLVTKTAREYLEVTVEFAIAEIRNLQDRAMVLGEVNAWAMAGGTLKVSYRPGQQLSVICQELPQIGYVREWTGTYKVVFRAYETPFWESCTVVSCIPKYGGTEIFVPGTAPTVVAFEASLISKLASGSSAMAYVRVYPDGDTLHFRLDGPYAKGTTIRVTYIGNILVTTLIKTDGTESKLGLIQSGNPDVLGIDPGYQKLSTYSSANQLYNITCTVRGRWY